MFRLLRSFTITSILALAIALGPLVWYQFDPSSRHLLRLGVIFGALWTALFLIVHVGDRALRRQYRELSRMRDEVRAQTEALAAEARQRRQAERELLILREIEISQRALHSLVRNLSHELRTPLNAIIGFSQLIAGQAAQAPADGRAAEYARHIETSAQHLLALLNSILELAKAEAGELKLNENPVDVHVVARDCLRLFAMQAEHGGVELVNLVPVDPPPLLVDERLFREILRHLLSNAVKFTPSAGRVTIRAGLEPDGAVRIEVADTGPGIPAEQIPRVMAPFGQADDALDRHHQGSGLGLPVVKSLVELHGGIFRLESAPGLGTRAAALFPACRVQRQAA
jgi:signal transduction histidine kinase